MIIGRTLTKEVGPLTDNNLLNDESYRQTTDAKEKEDMKEQAIGDEVIGAYSCLENSMPSTKILLNPPQECNIEDGSAYKKPTKRRAQILEHVRRIPVEVTTCVVQFRVNVGWCGGEFAIESYMHADLEALRS